MNKKTLVDITISIIMFAIISLTLVTIIAWVAPENTAMESGIQPCPMCDLTSFKGWIPSLIVIIGAVTILFIISLNLSSGMGENIPPRPHKGRILKG
jgi:hypothetical protein